MQSLMENNRFKCESEDVTVLHVPVPEALYYPRLDFEGRTLLYDRGFLSRSRLKAHAVVEDETWILVRVVLAVDVRFSNVVMSDINVGLHTFQLWVKCS